MVENAPAGTEFLGEELATSLTLSARALFGAGSVHATLQQIVDLAINTVDGCDYAGIFIYEGSVVTTPVFTDPIVLAVDQAQMSAGEGPCLDVLAGRGSIYADDFSTETRWPLFTAAASAEGVRSALAIQLSASETTSALNLYARFPQAFGALDRAKSQLLAALASVALASAYSHADAERQAHNLRLAAVTREVIGQAQGILMERERITAEDAFEILRRASQHLNVKLRDVAQNLVDTGERPDTGPVSPR